MKDYSELFKGVQESLLKQMTPLPVPLPPMGKTVFQEMAELADSNKASAFYERLRFWIKDFEESLNQDEEAGIRLVSFGQSVTFHVTEIGFHDPSLIVFHGVTGDEQKVTLVQHVTQISFLLMAMKKVDPNKPARRFGFAPPPPRKISKRLRPRFQHLTAK